jgi:uncharacterized protein (TIGR03067 family)
MVLSLAVLPCAAEAPRDRSETLKELAGEWRLESTADEKRKDAGSESIRMVIEGSGRVRFLFAGAQTNCGAFTAAKAGTRLKGIDLKVAGGKVYRGVYALEKGALLLCFDEAGKPRPAGLKPTGTQWLERWQPARKAGRPAPARCGKAAAETCVGEEAGKLPGGG